jgi:hypothetical protein
MGDTIEGLHESLNRFRDALAHPILRVSELHEKGQIFAEEGGA